MAVMCSMFNLHYFLKANIKSDNFNPWYYRLNKVRATGLPTCVYIHTQSNCLECQRAYTWKKIHIIGTNMGTPFPRLSSRLKK